MAERREILLALEQHTARAVATLATNCVAELIEATPVDTGWARANWIPTLGTPYAGGGRAAGEVTAVDTAAQQSGLAELLAYKPEDGPAFITNNVPYIQRLNDGSSTQAPAGFVELALERGIAATRLVLEDKP